ncbi:hypothetical protein Pyn_18590 [Prunus yedoensis var. nudiflora]|uniref:Uncharacterized protein n=1 Tax=Prunus yedoensis var. nudiflora TaxID=2094558 RepID=A0A314XN84_PRUYE|nr:hypothetical protein Pyn_18590 [Prunus yedoensis var. nudiflora]
MARLAMLSPWTIRCEMVNFPRELSLQKFPDAGILMICFRFQGALKALVTISCRRQLSSKLDIRSWSELGWDRELLKNEAKGVVVSQGREVRVHRRYGGVKKV